MIVKVNAENQSKYINIFKEAFNFLKNTNEYPELNSSTADRFMNLNEYYHYMAEFFNRQAYKYVLLPRDEAPFEIDLNARTVKVPANFSKCASVQKDQIAELVIFSADRFFDYMDLANTLIYVQWITPEDKKNNIPEKAGATRIKMVDLETEPGKIRFAWPLTDEVTAVAGNVKFSVRFFRLADGAEPNADNAGDIVYSLNTIENVIPIKAALQPDLTIFSAVERPVDESLFRDAVVNSNYSASGLIPPTNPVYGDPGSDLTVSSGTVRDKVVYGAIDENNTLNMKVKAVVADGGVVSYVWQYENDAKDQISDCAAVKFGSVEEKLIPFTNEEMNKIAKTGGAIGERYYKKINVNGADTDIDSYELIDRAEEEFAEIIADWTNLSNIPEDAKRLHTLYSVYTVAPGEDTVVTGRYWATAKNTVSSDKTNESMTTINGVDSRSCVLPAPIDLAFIENGNLPTSAILNAETGKENIGVTLVNDENHPNLEYTWYRSTTAEDSGFDSISGEAPSIEVSEPGWYTVEIEAILNRTHKWSTVDQTKNGESIVNICKVTDKPVAPIVQYAYIDVDDNKAEKFADGTRDQKVYSSLSSKTGNIVLKVKASIVNEDKLAEALVHDSYEYKWYYQDLNAEEWTPITKTGGFVTGLVVDGNNDISTVTLKHQATNSDIWRNFKCVVINHLNTDAAEFDHSISTNDDKDFVFVVSDTAD